MVNYLYNIVDQMFVGQGVGITGMAATNVAFPLTIIATALGLLIGDGGAAKDVYKRQGKGIARGGRHCYDSANAQECQTADYKA